MQLRRAVSGMERKGLVMGKLKDLYVNVEHDEEETHE
jgi:hypothetical protein